MTRIMYLYLFIFDGGLVLSLVYNTKIIFFSLLNLIFYFFTFKHKLNRAGVTGKFPFLKIIPYNYPFKKITHKNFTLIDIMIKNYYNSG